MGSYDETISMACGPDESLALCRWVGANMNYAIVKEGPRFLKFKTSGAVITGGLLAGMPSKPFDIELNVRDDGPSTLIAVHAGIAALGGGGTLKEEVSRFKNQLMVALQNQTSETSVSVTTLAQEVEKLHDLHQRGVLTKEEFEAGKRKLLGL